VAVNSEVEREWDAELQKLVEPRGDGGPREMREQLAQRRLGDDDFSVAICARLGHHGLAII
jgi:hypothetical protein